MHFYIYHESSIDYLHLVTPDGQDYRLGVYLGKIPDVEGTDDETGVAFSIDKNNITE